MSFSGSSSQRKFGFELDSKTIRRIFFRKHSAVNQVFVEVVELANSSSPAVLDARFIATLRNIIALCSSRTAHTESLRVLVCLIVPSTAPSSLALNQLCCLQQLYIYTYICIYNLILFAMANKIKHRIYTADSITGCCTTITVESRNTSLKSLCQQLTEDGDELVSHYIPSY